MTMTTISPYIAGNLLIGRRLEIWRESQAGIGRCEILLENQGNIYGGTIEPEDSIELKINGISMMKGYVDDALHNVNDPNAVYRNLMRVPGRDYGQDLANLLLTHNYLAIGNGAHVDDIFDSALSYTGSEIIYTSPHALDPLDYSFKNAYLLDGFKEMAKLMGLDFYVDDARVLQLFLLANAASSGIILQAIAGSALNNILDIKEFGEKIGLDIRNWIRIYSDNIDDHWTEGNASMWDNLSVPTETVTDDTSIFLVGAASIKCMIATAAQYRYHMCRLAMSTLLTGYSSIDLSNVKETAHYYARHNDDTEAHSAWRMQLEDSAGQVIEWSDFDHTDNMDQDKWYKVEGIPLGSDQDINASDPQTAAGWWWRTHNGSDPFDWEHIVAVRFTAESHGNAIHDNKSHWTDGLYLPIEAQAVREDIGGGSSQEKYHYRDLAIPRNDVKSQLQLNSLAVAELAHRKDPTQRLNLTATFQSGAKYAGQKIFVSAPDSGIGTTGTTTALGDPGETNIIDSNRTEAADYWNGCALTILSGECAGETCTIEDWDDLTHTFIVTPGFSGSILSGISYSLNISYRILGIHHIAAPGENLMRGFDAITEFDLVKEDQVVDPLRLRLTQNPPWTLQQRLEARIRAVEQGR